MTGQVTDLSWGLPTTTPIPPREVQEGLAASLAWALSKRSGPVPNSPEYLLLNQVIWKKEVNVFKIQRNIYDGRGQWRCGLRMLVR